MGNRDTDILQIKKYLDGELDAKAMHQLERRAQDDSFLMDALEGYENTKTNQQPNINELTKRLNQRLTKKQHRIIPWNILAVAASVLVIITAGGLWFYSNREAAKPQLASVTKPQTAPRMPPKAKDTAPAAKPGAIAGIPPNQQPQTLRKATPVARVNRAVASQSPVNTMAATKVGETENAEDDTSTNRLDEMVVMEHAKRKKDAAVAAESKLAAAPAAQINTAQANLIQGKVVGKDDGLPIPGAVVKVKGTNLSAVTDANGKFVLPKDSIKTTLAVKYTGYESKEVDTRNSLPVIVLNPTGSSLSEVVTSGFAKTKPDDEPHGIEAHPQNGWKAFKKYLADNAISPDGQEGIVKISFEISGFGEMSGTTVRKSLSPAADKKAIELINNGPRWIGNTTVKTETVTVRIKFKKQITRLIGILPFQSSF